jgi:hypothetical protein
LLEDALSQKIENTGTVWLKENDYLRSYANYNIIIENQILSTEMLDSNEEIR